MSIGQYLFSFGGRINRAKQWAYILVSFAFAIVEIVAVQTLAGFANILQVVTGKMPLTTITQGQNFVTLCAVLGFIFVVALYMRMAVTTKRLHDRNKSAWWLLVFVVLPVVLNIPRFAAVLHMLQNAGGMTGEMRMHRNFNQGGPVAILASGAASIISLWGFVELYCLRGTVGDNRYGADPLGGKS